MMQGFLIGAVLATSLGPAAGGRGGDQAEDAHPEARFLVVQKAASSVGFYTLDGNLVDTVPVGTHPHEVVLSTDGQTAYVTDYGAMSVEAPGEGGNTISLVDVRSRRKLGEIALGHFHRPHGIDVDRTNGRLVVTTENPNRLLLIDPASGRILRDFDTQGRVSHIVAVSPDGKRAFVSNVGSKNVSAVDLETGSVVLIPARERPEGSVLTRDGKTLYVANRESHTVTIIDTERNASVGEIPIGRGPARIRLSRDEKLLVYALLQDRRVGFADVGARKEIATVDLDGAPVSLQISPDGVWAYAAAQNEGTVYVISIAERKIVRQFKTSPGAGPDPVLDIGGSTPMPR